MTDSDVTSFSQSEITAEALRSALDHLTATDPDLALALAHSGEPPLRRSEAGFATLLRSIVGQQVSVQSARAVWMKLEGLLGGVTVETIIAAEAETLRAAGFSGQKARYARALALDIAEGRIDMAALAGMDDEAAIETLTKAKGVGRWTAEMYLMFALGRPDMMPVADIGIIVALQHLKGLPERPHAEQLLAMAEPWRPWRTVACLMLWHYRHNMPV